MQFSLQSLSRNNSALFRQKHNKIHIIYTNQKNKTGFLYINSNTCVWVLFLVVTLLLVLQHYTFFKTFSNYCSETPLRARQNNKPTQFLPVTDTTKRTVTISHFGVPAAHVCYCWQCMLSISNNLLTIPAVIVKWLQGIDKPRCQQ